jgi:hypothetical protein
MSQKKQILSDVLSDAKKHCLNLREIIYQKVEVDGPEISHMDNCELWISAKMDLLPKYFLDNWGQVRKYLNDAIQIDEQAKKMPDDGQEQSRLYDEVCNLRGSCCELLLSTATLIQRQLDSLS